MKLGLIAVRDEGAPSSTAIDLPTCRLLGSENYRRGNERPAGVLSTEEREQRVRGRGDR